MVSIVCVLCELCHVRKKRRRLADEKPHVGEECESTHGGAFRVRRSNDRNNRKTRVQERARLRHDQVRLKEFAAEWGRIQIWKRHRCRQNIDKWADRFHWSARVRAAMIADTERSARAAERAAFDVAKEKEKLALRHREQKLQASRLLFAKAREVLRQSAKKSRAPDAAKMFLVASTLGNEALGLAGSAQTAAFGLRPTAQPIIRVVLCRDALSAQRKKYEDKFFAEHPEIRRPKNGLEDATPLAAD